MPMGSYGSFEDCISDQQSKGHDADSARKICGAIKAKTESKIKTKNILVEYAAPIEAVKFVKAEENVPNGAMPIHGVAIKVTTSKNGVRYLPEELRKAAATFIGRPMIKDHEAKMDNVVGRITNAYYVPEKEQVEFDGLVMDKHMQEMVTDGRAREVSIRAGVGSLEEEDLNGVKAPTARDMSGEEISFVVIPGVEGAGLTNSFDGAVCEAYQKLKVTEEMTENKVEEKIEAKVEAPVKAVEAVKEAEMPMDKPMPEKPMEQPAGDGLEKKVDMLIELMQKWMAAQGAPAPQPSAEAKAEVKTDVKEKVELKIVGEAASKTKVAEESNKKENSLIETRVSPSGAVEYAFKFDASKYRKY